MSTSQVVYKVTRPATHGNLSCIHNSWDAVGAEFDGAEDGEVISVEIQHMTPEQIAALPEFEGW